MGFFDQFHKKGSPAIKPQEVKIRTEIVRAKANPLAPRSSPQLKANARPTVSRQSSGVTKSDGTSSDRRPTRAAAPASERKSKSLKPRTTIRKRSSPALQHLSSSSDEVSDDEALLALSRKRVKASESVEPDLNRKVRSSAAFSEDKNAKLSFVHAADIASLEKPNKFAPAFDDSCQSHDIQIRYPSAGPVERYQLVHPREHDDFNSLEDIIQTVSLVLDHYLPASLSEKYTDDSNGITRRLKRAISHNSETEFRAVLTEYNTLIHQSVLNGTIASHLDTVPSPLPLPLIERILTQTYARTVSPRVTSLRQYENGTDNVYGELLPRFISQIFKDTHLQSHHLFLDLGSGVANVVLQAALEIGCESWGCEMMTSPCDLAELQQAEFTSRCALWGLSPGVTHLERGDFLTNAHIAKILPLVDVVLVNNQAFTPSLNSSLMNLFLDLKDGCQIVSLKSFVPQGHKITKRNFNSPVNLLRDVKMKRYWSDSVSWTDGGGTYFVARKDGEDLRKWAQGEGLL
ncbi:MAG: hypothetical protein M1819_005109 [Sarea resinae]|nr:MAG: hypothetical protein M1819_005109 [Sarea resinae]